MEINNGYIYIRVHPSYDSDETCKLGKTTNIYKRDATYATGELKRGVFKMVFEVNNVDEIERLLQKNFQKINIKYDGGCEFYKKEIIDLIEPFLIKNKIQHKKLSKGEINDLLTDITQRVESININKYTPKDYQTSIIEKSCEYFQINNKGVLVIPCGVGKTLISLWVTQKLNSNTIIIGVPNKLLLLQWKQTIYDIFQNISQPYIVSGGVNEEDIKHFLEENQKKCIIITTYSSAHKVYNVTNTTPFKFDMKILDEAHHLTTSNMEEAKTKNTYIKMLQISSNKQLSLTATLKQIENNYDNGHNTISNDSLEYFGEIIDRKCLLWAINKDIICDYIIQTIIADEDQLTTLLIKFHIYEEIDKRLFLSAITSLKSIFHNHSHHLLIYSNNRDNSFKIIQYIKLLLCDNYFNIPELYYSEYHGNMKVNDQKEVLSIFEKSKFGIITCVYCLGEGWDLPLLDGVVFAENMSSNIRIVQSALRACRKNKNDIYKKMKIILPILNTDDWLEDTTNYDFKHVKKIIYHMGLEDKTIIQKISVFKLNLKTQILKSDKSEDDRSDIDFGEYDDELTEQIRLKNIERGEIGKISYNKAKKIVNINKIYCKSNYYKLCEEDNRLPIEPEDYFKTNFKGWIDYLNIEPIYYDLEECKRKINEYLTLYPNFKNKHFKLINICDEICKIDKLFPPNDLWTDYYNVKHLQDIIIINYNKKKSGLL